MGKVTKYNYDPVTKLLAYIENANSVQTAYIYDNRDRTSKIYLDSDEDGIPDTAEPQVAYLYANNRLSGIDTATTDYTLTYDIWGNVLSIKADNYTLATYEYAANNGKLKKLTYGNGDYEEYVYDELERLVQTKLNGVTEYTVKYDANGRLYSLTENDSTHIYEYDSLDRLVRAWQEDANGNITVAVENSYDDLGRAKGSTYVVDDRTMSYEVNYKANSNLVSSLRMPDASSGGIMSSLNYTYDEFERWIRKNTSLSTMREFYEEYEYYTYTDANGIEHATTLVSSVTLGVMVNGQTTSVVYSYTYDNLGNITQIKKDGVIINEYTYDSLGQLTCEEDAVAGKTYIYYYDKSGNITQKDSYPFAEGATRGDYISYLASQKETVSTYIYNNSTWGDLLGVYNGKIILYDAIGNPTNWRNAKSLIWEGRKLISQTLNSDDTLTYAYNSDGIRTQKKKFDFITGEYRTHNYVLDGSTIIKETVTDPAYSLNYTLYYLYDEAGSIQGFIYNNAYYYFQKNLQGDVVRILNNYGDVVTEYTYDAWGKVLTTTGTLASTIGQYNPFRYRGYYYDTETGFYYLQSRYYDPTVARFLNADGIVGANGGIVGNNMNVYCSNNPVSFVDEDGFNRKPTTKIINDGFGGDVGPLGIIGSDEGPVLGGFYDAVYGFFAPNTKEKEWALYDNDRFEDNNSWHEQFVHAEYTTPSIDLTSGDLTFGSVSADLYTGGWEGEYVDFSFLDFFHAELGAGIEDGRFQCSAMASAWSPSFAFEIFGVTVEIGAEVGSVGTAYDRSSSSFSFSISWIFGISIGLDW